MTQLTFWGVTASPYQLKMQALADAAGIPWQRAPEQLSSARALGMAWRLRRAIRTESIERLPSRVAGLDAGAFARVVDEAAALCPVSRLFAGAQISVTPCPFTSRVPRSPSSKRVQTR